MALQSYGRSFSNLLRRYYLGPNHPAKLRFWRYFRTASGWRLLTVPYQNNLAILVDERDFLQHHILSSGLYEPEVFATLRQHATGDEVLWDVGANIGSVSMVAAQCPEIAEVVAFEPDPLHYERLMANRQLNNLSFNAQPVALGAGEEMLTLSHGPEMNSGMASVVSTYAGTKQFQVRCSTVDTYVYKKNFRPPTLLKIDVRGYELPVLRGAVTLFATKPPKAVVFEAAVDQHGAIVERELEKFFSDRGYGVTQIQRPERVVLGVENFVAVRRAEAAN